MNITNCSNCGVVLDKDHIEFPTLYDERGNIVHPFAIWNGDKFVVKAQCPVCKEHTLED